MPVTYLLTCEHAGNEIPAEYASLFKGKEEVLVSHKATDLGALRLAKHLASELKLPLYYNLTARLLVEHNRSLDSEELFSEFSLPLPEKDKQQVLEKYYFLHRNQVEATIAAEIRAGRQVVHFAIHSFTPAMDGAVRPAEIGILFDEKRPPEKNLAKELKTALQQQNPDRRVLYNSPYPGTSDGFPAYLRKIFDQESYAGFELEINQKFFLNGEPDVWDNLVTEVTRAVKEVIAGPKSK